jgi:hypothetical protein
MAMRRCEVGYIYPSFIVFLFPSFFLPTTTTSSTNISSTIMDDNSSPTNISSTNTVDDNYDDDGWTAEEEAHLTEAWLLLLLRGPDSIKVQDIMYRLLRDMELTNEDFEIASVDLQMLGTNRDAEELK